MRGQHHSSTLLAQVLEGLQRGSDARVVGDGAVAQRNVQIRSQEHALPLERQVRDGPGAGSHSLEAIISATSTRRLA